MEKRQDSKADSKQGDIGGIAQYSKVLHALCCMHGIGWASRNPDWPLCNMPHTYIHAIYTTYIHTCSVPAKRHHFGRAATGDPDSEETDEEARKIRQHVSCVSHYGETVGQPTSCRYKQEVVCV